MSKYPLEQVIGNTRKISSTADTRKLESFGFLARSYQRKILNSERTKNYNIFMCSQRKTTLHLFFFTFFASIDKRQEVTPSPRPLIASKHHQIE